MTRLSVGSFQLEEPLARGGMGSVWRAVHRSGVAAAVKIIPAETAGGLDAAATLQAEIRAIGALEHPNIVRVYDAGMIEAEHEAASGGQLRAGSPWLAMELADGSVHELARSLDWTRLVELLIQVLDALAHAHARGVVHRDLKPANLLYVRSHALRILLADFGLAWRRGADPVHGGSLPYAAPEQILGLRTEQGPWTDLYGLGCCAYRLATGARPYKGSDPEQIKRGHLFAPIPRPIARFPTPRGFGDWLAGMMAKDPRERFQCAADAAYALVQLPPPRDPGARDEDDIDTVSTRARAPDGAATLPVTDWVRAPRRVAPQGGPQGIPPQAAAAAVRAPIPVDWASPQQHRATALGGRGLGLFGLRLPPIAGRTAERDHLWALLLELDRPRLAILRGGAGVGKSRLASWLVERAYEVGAAEVFRARFSAGSPGEGLGGLAEEHLNTHGMDSAEIVRHLRHRVSPGDLGRADREAYALARLLRPDDPLLAEDPLPGAERVAVAWRLIARRADERRLIVWLDDAQQSVESLALVEHAATLPDPPAVLFVLTVRDESAPIRERLRSLCERLDGEQIDLEPLTEREIETLVGRMLPAEGDLAARIASHSGGSPLVAMQLVASLIERGALRGDPGGVRLESTELLPVSLADVWTGALDRLDAPGARDALRIAAVLGPTFAHAQWRDVAHRLGRPFGAQLPAALVNRGLLVPERTGGRYSFAHALLHEVLLGEARGLGPAIDLACAGSLSAQGSAYAGRAAAHLEAAGAHAEAADAYLVAMRWLADWDRERALELSARWYAALERSADRDDSRWVDGLQVIVGLGAGEGGDAHRRAVEELLERGRAIRDRAAEIRALIELVYLDLRSLALDRAEARAELAAHIARGTVLSPLAAIARAEVRRIRGDLRTAEATLGALAVAERGADLGPLLAMSKVLCDAGRGAEALALLDAWADQQSRAQPPMARARLQHARGLALGALGRWREAAVALEDAVRTGERSGFASSVLRLDHGWALVCDGQIDAARATLAPLGDRLSAAMDLRHHAQLLATRAEIALCGGDVAEATACVRALEALPVRGHRRITIEAMQRLGSRARAGEHHGLSHRARRWADRVAAAATPLDGSRTAE